MPLRTQVATGFFCHGPPLGGAQRTVTAWVLQAPKFALTGERLAGGGTEQVPTCAKAPSDHEPAHFGEEVLVS